MDEYLDLEAELPVSEDNSEEEAPDEEAIRPEGVSDMPSGGNEGTQSLSPKCHQTTMAKPTCGRKKTV